MKRSLCDYHLACIALIRIAAAVIATASLLHTQAVAQSVQSGRPEDFGKIFHCKPGPWGDLDYYYIHLEMPDHLVERHGVPDPLPRWIFPGGTEATLRLLFQSAGISQSLQAYLLDPAHQILKHSVLTVFPPLPELIEMTREQRAIIYRELAKSEANAYHANPVCIMNDDPDAWFAESRLRPELREVVKKMAYMRGDVLCFSDVAAVIGMVKSDKEAHDFLKAMSRTSSLVLRLNVKTSADLDQVARYWSGNQPNTDIEPMILSAAKTDDINHLDCIHLLPALARRHLYTYPSEELPIYARLPDCYWTSLNFFNSAPLNYHLDQPLLVQHVTEDYEVVRPPYRFGDVLTFNSPTGWVPHSFVFIADDIVYTKNGGSFVAPWQLMKLGDLRRLYSYEQQLSIEGHRLKPRPTRADD